MSTKMWEVTVEHAKTCILDKKLFLYCPSSQQKNHVVFNAVGQLMGLLSEDQYILADKLSETEKARISFSLTSTNSMLGTLDHYQLSISLIIPIVFRPMPRTW